MGKRSKAIPVILDLSDVCTYILIVWHDASTSVTRGINITWRNHIICYRTVTIEYQYTLYYKYVCAQQ
jgi:hypothetical protein